MRTSYTKTGYNTAMLDELESQNDDQVSEMAKRVGMLKDVSRVSLTKLPLHTLSITFPRKSTVTSMAIANVLNRLQSRSATKYATRRRLRRK